MMRLLFLCSFVVLCLVSTGRGYADEHFPFLAEVSRSSVNVRAGGNTNFEIIDKLVQGAEVVVLGHTFEWYKVQLPSTASAYLRADYVKIYKGGLGELSGDRVNVRAKASSDSSPLGQLHKGAIVRLVDKTNDWWKIDPPAGTFGWIHQDFLKLKSPDVPVQALRKPLSAPLMEAAAVPNHPELTSAEPVPVTVKGKLQVLVPPPSPDVHYQVMVDGRAMYYLRDAPHLDRFSQAIVRVDGIAAPESKSAFPVLRIKKISLLL